MTGSRDSLEAMNEHLARFFQHADQLLVEWKQYGDRLRSSIDAEAEHLRRAVAEAMKSAGQEAGEHIDMERALGHSLVRLRREVDELAQTVGEARGRGRAGASPVVVAMLAVANLLLVAVLVVSVRSCRSGAEKGAEAQPAQLAAPVFDAAPPVIDAAPAIDAAPTAAQTACSALAAEAGPDQVRAFSKAAAAELCGAQAEAAGAAIESALDGLSGAKKRGGQSGKGVKKSR